LHGNREISLVTVHEHGPHREDDESKPMMNASEKSDLPVVAMKSANNAEVSVAESMEPRDKAERNATQHGTNQTQGWVDMSHALGCRRKIAKARPDERFTALLHHVTPELLRNSYHGLKRDAAPGVDGVTRKAYEQDLEANLCRLHVRV